MCNHFTAIDGVSALEDGRVECGGMNRGQESQLLLGAMFIRCSTPQAAKAIIRLIDRAPSLQGRKLKAMHSQLEVFPAQKWKQEQFRIGTNRIPEMLLRCPADINDVDAGVMKFGMECS